MISKAVERAQNTVEQRNAEIRKDVLKYDEVLNEQRKVIYARRMQVLEGEDLRDQTFEVLAEAMEEAVDEYCQTDYPEDWDLDGLVKTVTTYYPTQFKLEELQQASTKEQLVESFIAEGTSYYESREKQVAENFGNPDVMREVEREVMLQIIDSRWREHLSEMDYLRDGINLRAMGQKDPLVEWQTDGFEFFGQMMGAINSDYLRYVMHVDVAPEQIAQPEVQLDQASFAAPEDNAVQGAAAIQQAAVGFDAGEAFAATASQGAGDGVRAEDIPQAVQQVVRSDAEKTGRNDPCWCGSGKKFKHCHGS
jgi:preprotein translocase subunit SecA